MLTNSHLKGDSATVGQQPKTFGPLMFDCLKDHFQRTAPEDSGLKRPVLTVKRDERACVSAEPVIHSEVSSQQHFYQLIEKLQ